MDKINEWELHMARVQFYAHLEEAMDNQIQLLDYFNRGIELLHSVDRLTNYQRWIKTGNKMLITYPVFNKRCFFTFSNRDNVAKYCGVSHGDRGALLDRGKRIRGYHTIPRRLHLETAQELTTCLHKYVDGDGYV